MNRQNYVYNSMRKEGSIRNQIFIISCINIGQIIVGYSVGWTAPVLPKLENAETSPLPEPITDQQGAWIGSLLYVGSIIGPYITGYLSNRIGRKPCILIGGLLNVLTYILVITTNSLAMVYALRVIAGLGMGVTVVCNIVYVGEIASTHIRGILLTSTSIVGITGTLIIYAVGPWVSYAATGYIGLALSAAHVIGVLFIPESPVYYAIKEKEPEVYTAMQKLGRAPEAKQIVEAFSQQPQTTSVKDWTEIFTIKSNRMSFFITFCLVGLQQLSGVSAVLFFATSIFEIAGSSIDPDIATIAIGGTRLFSSVFAPPLVERIGRKMLLMVSQCACAVSLSILGVYFFLDRVDNPVIESIGWLPLVALIVYFFSYEAGFGVIPNTIVGEMYRANVRSNGSALTMTLGWLIGFALTTVFAGMVRTLGGDVTFWIFGGACIVAFFFTLFFIPETKGKTLDEIQDMMS